VFFRAGGQGNGPAVRGDLFVTATAAGVRPQIQCLYGCQRRTPVQTAHGLQDIHQDDEGLGQMLIDRRPAAVEQAGELPVGGLAKIDEVADPHQAAPAS